VVCGCDECDVSSDKREGRLKSYFFVVLCCVVSLIIYSMEKGTSEDKSVIIGDIDHILSF
jgi:hypothetical protein